MEPWALFTGSLLSHVHMDNSGVAMLIVGA